MLRSNEVPFVPILQHAILKHPSKWFRSARMTSVLLVAPCLFLPSCVVNMRVIDGLKTNPVKNTNRTTQTQLPLVLGVSEVTGDFAQKWRATDGMVVITEEARHRARTEMTSNVRSALISYFSNSGLFKHVVEQPTASKVDLILDLRLNVYETEYQVVSGSSGFNTNVTATTRLMISGSFELRSDSGGTWRFDVTEVFPARSFSSGAGPGIRAAMSAGERAGSGARNYHTEALESFLAKALQKIASRHDEIAEVASRSSSIRAGSTVGHGTGFAVSPNGHIVTAWHLVAGAAQVRVRFGKEPWLDANVLHHSSALDVALLQVASDTPAYLEFAQTGTASQGQRVFTLGFPATSVLGVEPKYSEGVISATSGLDDDVSLLQVTVPVQPGNSGGALVSLDGQVVGMMTSTAAILAFLEHTGTLPQNINWAVKADYLVTFVEQSIGAFEPMHVRNKLDTAVTLARQATCFVEAIPAK